MKQMHILAGAALAAALTLLLSACGQSDAKTELPAAQTDLRQQAAQLVMQPEIRFMQVRRLLLSGDGMQYLSAGITG